MFDWQRFCVLLAACAMCLVSAAAHAEDLGQIDWVRQWGTAGDDWGRGVCVDGLGNVYFAGLRGNSSDGPGGGLLGKYDAAGNLLWTRHLAPGVWSEPYGVAMSAPGELALAGRTAVMGSQGHGFVAKSDVDGNLLWAQDLGLEGDWCQGVAADGLGNVYATTSHSVAKYGAAGNLLWTGPAGTDSRDHALAIAADAAGNAYVAGYTERFLKDFTTGDDAAFVTKYDADGNVLWLTLFGSDYCDDWVTGVSVDAQGGVFLGGHTEGTLAAPGPLGPRDAFAAKCDSNGGLLWVRQLGASGAITTAQAVSTDGLGNVYVAGETDGSLGGPNAGENDAFVTMFDAVGNLRWTQQLGTTASEGSLGISADGHGTVYTTGWTQGPLGGPNAGYNDLFVAKIVVPEPGTAGLAVAAVLCTVLWRPWGARTRRRA